MINFFSEMGRLKNPGTGNPHAGICAGRAWETVTPLRIFAAPEELRFRMLPRRGIAQAPRSILESAPSAGAGGGQGFYGLWFSGKCPPASASNRPPPPSRTAAADPEGPDSHCSIGSLHQVLGPGSSYYSTGYAPPPAPQSLSFILLDYLIIFNRRHLTGVVKEYAMYYIGKRPHQGINQLVPSEVEGRIPVHFYRKSFFSTGNIHSAAFLGGFHHSYSRGAGLP
jgi:hypothetical protein